MSPERLLGQTCDGSSDIYSLGILIYEMLSGKQPFESEQQNFFAIVQTRLTKEPKPLSKFLDTLPLKLESVILNSIARNPNKRPTAIQLRAILYSVYSEINPDLTSNTHCKLNITKNPNDLNDLSTLSMNIAEENNTPTKDTSTKSDYLNQLLDANSGLLNMLLPLLGDKQNSMNLPKSSSENAISQALVGSSSLPNNSNSTIPDSNDRWKQVEELFQDLLSVPSEEREHLLMNKINVTASIQAEVLSLLKAYEEAEQEDFSLSFPKKPEPKE
jgi:hypothetical protein